MSVTTSTPTTTMPVRDVSLFVEVVGRGDPLVLMHGGPRADHCTLLPFRRLSDRFTLIFYDHRCNGRPQGAPVSSMTWENLTADAEAPRQRLGFERWAVLGHSFGGHVALEYALRYPASLSHLVLLDTGGDSRWSQEQGPQLLARRGYGPRTVELAGRFFNGQIAPNEMMPALLRFGGAYYHDPSLVLLAREMLRGGWRTKTRPEALIFAGRQLLKGWTVMDRLDQITVPTLVLAGRDDFLFPPEHQRQLAAGIPGARLQIIERAGHNAHSERPTEVLKAVTDFISAGRTWRVNAVRSGASAGSRWDHAAGSSVRRHLRTRHHLRGRRAHPPSLPGPGPARQRQPHHRLVVDVAHNLTVRGRAAPRGCRPRAPRHGADTPDRGAGRARPGRAGPARRTEQQSAGMR